MEALVVPELAHGLVGNLLEHLHKKKSVLSMYGTHMIHQLHKSGLSAKQLIWSQILPTAGGMVANQGQLFAQCLDFYLSDEAGPHLKEINRLAKLDTDEADELLLRYFMEGSRIRATVGLYRAVAKETDPIQDGERSIDVKPGDEVLCDLVTACMDPTAFPEPDKVKLDRPLDSYIHFGWGPHSCLGSDVCKLALTTMLKTVGQLDNLRRAPGSQGQIKKVPGPGGITLYMTPNQASFFPFPTTMKVRWDGALPLANQ
jgi:linoleate 8R-lipoxygenase/9,12-octadecadienoate 8-hydroperoxide 8R-isomerase